MNKNRPFSATSTTASFGSRCYSKIKDLSMQPHISIYKTNGYGRDSYIEVPNGGFRKEWHNSFVQNYHTKLLVSECMKKSSSPGRFCVYRPNGLGRDSYIYKNCGGFDHSESYPLHYSSFFGELRNYKYDPLVNDSIIKKKYDYNRYVKLFRRPHEIHESNIRNRMLKALSGRLSQPKRRREKIVK